MLHCLVVSLNKHEIRTLKEELEQLKRGIVTIPQLKHTEGDDIVILKQKVKVAGNRIIQEQLNQKIDECEKLQQTVLLLKGQLSEAEEYKNLSQMIGNSKRDSEPENFKMELSLENEPTVSKDMYEGSFLKAQTLREREHSYEAALEEKDQREAELQRRVEESKQKEAYLENELGNMWVLVAKLKKPQGSGINASELTRESPVVDDDYKIWNGTK